MLVMVMFTYTFDHIYIRNEHLIISNENQDVLMSLLTCRTALLKMKQVKPLILPCYITIFH